MDINKKDKDLKNRTRYSSSFNSELLEKFKNLSKKTDIPLSKLFDRAMSMLLKEYDENKEPRD